MIVRAQEPDDHGEVVAQGLNGLRGFLMEDAGMIYVARAGGGGRR